MGIADEGLAVGRLCFNALAESVDDIFHQLVSAFELDSDFLSVVHLEYLMSIYRYVEAFRLLDCFLLQWSHLCHAINPEC